MSFKKRLARGFTLVELMIVVAIVGVLAALAIYGVRKYINNAKTAEARNALGQLSKDASAAYDREGMPGSVLAPGSVAAASNQLCKAAQTTVPGNQDSIKGQKYQSDPTEWAADADDRTGWKCLKFHVKDPQYYMYQYYSDETGDGAGVRFEAYAFGDLNGDSKLSTFKLAGQIQGTDKKELMIAPNIEETDPNE